jgi:hypothetical protein
MPKYCVNCVYHETYPYNPDWNGCNRKEEISLVTGTKSPTNVNCATERSKDGSCKPEGLFYSAVYQT